MRRALSALVAAASFTAAAPATAQVPRALVDRPDDWPRTTPQVHVLYVIPSDGADRALDTNGTLAASVDSFQRWLAGQSGGRALRPDTVDGEVDVTFHRLARSDADVASNGAFVRDVLERDLRAAGLIATGKLYAVYYDGSSTFACGGGAWPPVIPGQVGALYLRGMPPGAVPCATNTFAPPGGAPGYMEFAMLHELFHTLGAVPQCAPNHTLAGHASEDPRDLMYAGLLAWRPSLLDVGRDDYFGHGRSGCLDLATSELLVPLGAKPPPVRVGPLVGQGVPRAGRTFVVTMRVLNDPHEVVCRAWIGRRGLRTTAALAGGPARCAMRVPARTRGRQLEVQLAVERGESAAGSGRSFRIR